MRAGNSLCEGTMTTRCRKGRGRFAIRRARSTSSPSADSASIVAFKNIPKMTAFMSKRQIKDLSGTAPSAMGIAVVGIKAQKPNTNQTQCSYFMQLRVLCKMRKMSGRFKAIQTDFVEFSYKCLICRNPPQLLVVMDEPGD